MSSTDNIPAHRFNRHDKVLQPLSDSLQPQDIELSSNADTAAVDLALNLIRQKLQSIYSEEPDAKEEQKEAEHLTHRSKHQQFMYELSHSGRPLAEIQTAWHTYYTNLPNAEKHEVWREFYATHGHQLHHAGSRTTQAAPEATQAQEPEPSFSTKAEKTSPHKTPKPYADPRTVSELKKQIVRKVSARSRHKASSYVQSILFGLASGVIVVVLLLFGLFNERFIAPFITPSRAVSSTPIIIDPSSTAVGPESQITIPKINVEIPVVYDEPSIEEAKVQAALDRGVVHYGTTPNPGEKGNAVIFGHSANNILNKGKYKFAFVLLKELEPGDTFYLQRDGKRYVYKVYEKKIVPPAEVSVLHPTEKTATATLITCDPPGTVTNRLVVIGEQISPDPATNVASTAASSTSSTDPAELPGEPTSLWNRIRSIFE